MECVRVRVWMPVPQVRVQLSKLPQVPSTQLTGHAPASQSSDSSASPTQAAPVPTDPHPDVSLQAGLRVRVRVPAPQVTVQALNSEYGAQVQSRGHTWSLQSASFMMAGQGLPPCFV